MQLTDRIRPPVLHTGWPGAGPVRVVPCWRSEPGSAGSFGSGAAIVSVQRFVSGNRANPCRFSRFRVRQPCRFSVPVQPPLPYPPPEGCSSFVLLPSPGSVQPCQFSCPGSAVPVQPVQLVPAVPVQRFGSSMPVQYISAGRILIYLTVQERFVS